MKYKKKHGTKNTVILQEEKSILLAVDRALSSSSNSQTIGRNGEIPILDFLNRYLPPTFKAASGHFITQEGDISPQIDVMVLDSRYPLLAENLDGSVLAMLHSVVQTIEVKTNLTSGDVKKISTDIQIIRSLIDKVDDYKDACSYKTPITSALAYRIKNKLESITKAYRLNSNPALFHFDLSILRLNDNELNDEDVGCQLHYEPIIGIGAEELKKKYDLGDEDICDGFLLTSIPCYTVLSDFYYHLVQSGYYILGERDYSYSDIGEHIMEYMEWSTVSWETLYLDT